MHCGSGEYRGQAVCCQGGTAPDYRYVFRFLWVFMGFFRVFNDIEEYALFSNRFDITCSRVLNLIQQVFHFHVC